LTKTWIFQGSFMGTKIYWCCQEPYCLGI